MICQISFLNVTHYLLSFFKEKKIRKGEKLSNHEGATHSMIGMHYQTSIVSVALHELR